MERYIAQGVDRWDLLEERGFAFFLTKERQDGVWFHVTELPEEIRHWFPREGKRQPYMPKVSFEIVAVQKNNKTEEQAANICLEPPISEREVIWRNGDKLTNLSNGKTVDILLDKKINLQSSEFWCCQLLSVFHKNESRYETGNLMIPTQKFLLGTVVWQQLASRNAIFYNETL